MLELAARSDLYDPGMHLEYPFAAPTAPDYTLPTM
jgi:hypothetical protein